MRIGAFMLGGILGAAAVVYLQRSNRPMIVSALNTAGDQIGKAVNTARSSMTNMNVTSMFGKSLTKEAEQMYSDKSAKNMGKANNSASGQGLQKVETMVEQDPSVSKEVENILEESGVKTYKM